MVRILLKKQLMEIFRSYFYDTRRNKARSRLSTAMYIALFALLMFGFLGGSFGSMAMSLCAPLVSVGAAWLYFVLFSLIALLLGVFGSVFSTYTGLYLAKDNDLLFSLPIPPGAILCARLLGVYLMGLLYTSVVIVPAVAVYLLNAPFSVGALLGSLLLIFLLSVIVLLLSCLLGWVVAKVSLRLKNKSFVTVLLSLGFLALYYVGYFRAMNWVEGLIANAAQISASLRSRAAALYVFGRMGEGDGLSMLLCTLVVGVLFVLVWLLLSKSFFAVATATGPVKAARGGYSRVRRKSPDAALLAKEFGRLGSSANYILDCALGAMLLPVAGVALLLRGSALVGALNGVFGSLKGAVCVLLCVMLCSVSSMIDTAAASVSLEGKNIWLPRSLPVRPWQVLRAKLRVQLLLAMPALLFASLCAAVVLRADALETLALVLQPQSFALFFAHLGLWLDLRRGNLAWTNELAPIKQSLTILIILLGGFAAAALPALGFLLLAPPLPGSVWMLLFALAGFLGALLLRLALRRRGETLFMEL